MFVRRRWTESHRHTSQIQRHSGRFGCETYSGVEPYGHSRDRSNWTVLGHFELDLRHAPSSLKNLDATPTPTRCVLHERMYKTSWCQTDEKDHRRCNTMQIYLLAHHDPSPPLLPSSPWPPNSHCRLRPGQSTHSGHHAELHWELCLVSFLGEGARLLQAAVKKIPPLFVLCLNTSVLLPCCLCLVDSALIKSGNCSAVWNVWERSLGLTSCLFLHLQSVLSSVRVDCVAQRIRVGSRIGHSHLDKVALLFSVMSRFVCYSCDTGHRCAHSAVARARVGGVVHWSLFIVQHDNHSQW